jgi:hypothetical protein
MQNAKAYHTFNISGVELKLKPCEITHVRCHTSNVYVSCLAFGRTDVLLTFFLLFVLPSPFSLSPLVRKKPRRMAESGARGGPLEVGRTSTPMRQREHTQGSMTPSFLAEARIEQCGGARVKAIRVTGIPT